MSSFDFVAHLLGMRSPTLNFGGGGGGSGGPTVQQQQLQTQQAVTNANLNLQENAQRKSILNAMMGTRVFRGSALSRAMRGDTPGGADAVGAPSSTQTSVGRSPVSAGQSLLDTRESRASGATPSGGAGASASTDAVSAGAGAYVGGARGAPGRLGQL